MGKEIKAFLNRESPKSQSSLVLVVHSLEARDLSSKASLAFDKSATIEVEFSLCLVVARK